MHRHGDLWPQIVAFDNLLTAARQAQRGRRFREKDIMQSLRSWIAHLAHGDTWRLREQIFTALVFTRG